MTGLFTVRSEWDFLLTVQHPELIPPFLRQENLSHRQRAAAERGITFCDTAEAYGPCTNEELVG